MRGTSRRHRAARSIRLRGCARYRRARWLRRGRSRTRHDDVHQRGRDQRQGGALRLAGEPTGTADSGGLDIGARELIAASCSTPTNSAPTFSPPRRGQASRRTLCRRLNMPTTTRGSRLPTRSRTTQLLQQGSDNGDQARPQPLSGRRLRADRTLARVGSRHYGLALTVGGSVSGGCAADAAPAASPASRVRIGQRFRLDRPSEPHQCRLRRRRRREDRRRLLGPRRAADRAIALKHRRLSALALLGVERERCAGRAEIEDLRQRLTLAPQQLRAHEAEALRVEIGELDPWSDRLCRAGKRRGRDWPGCRYRFRGSSG